MDIFDQFQSLPLFTRSWLGLTFAITAAVTLDAIPAHQVFLDWDRITNVYSFGSRINRYGSYDRPELWRLLTSFCYCGAPLNEIHSLFLLYTIYIHSKGYETNPFPAGSGSRTADAIFAGIFCMIMLLCTHCVPRYLFGPKYQLYPILTRNLAGSLLYLWSKRNPRAMIQLNFIPMEGRYLPFAHIGISLFMGNRLHELVHGFVIGHLYYFLIAIAPVHMGGKRILRTPRFLVELLGEEGIMEPEEFELYGTRQEREQHTYRNQDGATSAHIAAKLGNLSDLQELVEATTSNAGGLLTASDRNGWQPLHEACRAGHTEVVQYLVVEQRQYVDVHATTNAGESALSLSQQFHGENHPVTKLLERTIHSDNDDDDDDDSEESCDED
mmetsp:Transcript_14889/g.34466  ORF Transcript_14889/g.34466 Transcript_14889/m.34466 type:complete len:384 (+) Transcript_14889:97-1248(+)